MKQTKWTKEEEDLLKQYAYAPMKEIIERLPIRNRKTIYWKLNVLGFNRETYRRYNEQEDSYIKNNFSTKGNRAIARELKRTEKSVTKRMIILGLKRTDEELHELRSKHSSVYQKGRVSEKLMPQGSLQLIYDSKSESSFYNIKIGQKYVRFSRYLYEMYNNEKLNITDIIKHIDGNSMNVLKENLIKIDRLELLQTNINSDEAFVKRIFRINDSEAVDQVIKEFPELIALKRNTMLLTKKIKENERIN